jgi:hypothetical protein
MGNTLLDDSSRWEVTSPIGVLRVGRKEPHVMPLGTDNKGELGLVVGSTDLGGCLSEERELLPGSSAWFE